MNEAQLATLNEQRTEIINLKNRCHNLQTQLDNSKAANAELHRIVKWHRSGNKKNQTTPDTPAPMLGLISDSSAN